jgi:hypothetical protein
MILLQRGELLHILLKNFQYSLIYNCTFHLLILEILVEYKRDRNKGSFHKLSTEKYTDCILKIIVLIIYSQIYMNILFQIAFYFIHFRNKKYKFWVINLHKFYRYWCTILLIFCRILMSFLHYELVEVYREECLRWYTLLFKI